MEFIAEKLQEILAHCKTLEERIVALEQHAHSSHNVDGEAIAAHVNQRLNDHLRDLFVKKQETEAPEITQEKPAPVAP